MKPRICLSASTLVGGAIVFAALALAQNAERPPAPAAAAQPGQKQLVGAPGSASPAFTITQTPPTATAPSDLPQAPRVDNKMIK